MPRIVSKPININNPIFGATAPNMPFKNVPYDNVVDEDGGIFNEYLAFIISLGMAGSQCFCAGAEEPGMNFNSLAELQAILDNALNGALTAYFDDNDRLCIEISENCRELDISFSNAMYCENADNPGFFDSEFEETDEEFFNLVEILGLHYED